MSTITVDTARLPLLLHELRLPAVSRLWQVVSAGLLSAATISTRRAAALRQ
jgi:hypothetical protein